MVESPQTLCSYLTWTSNSSRITRPPIQTSSTVEVAASVVVVVFVVFVVVVVVVVVTVAAVPVAVATIFIILWVSSLVLLIVDTLYHGPFRRRNTNPGASSELSSDGFEDGSSGISILLPSKLLKQIGHPGMLKAETSAVLETESFQFTRFPYRGVSTAKNPSHLHRCSWLLYPLLNQSTCGNSAITNSPLTGDRPLQISHFFTYLRWKLENNVCENPPRLLSHSFFAPVWLRWSWHGIIFPFGGDL